LLAYLVAGGSIGILGAFRLRRVAHGGLGIAWQADPWPRGVQEEDLTGVWGSSDDQSRDRTSPAAVARSTGSIEELAEASTSGVSVQPVRR
jgi:hypothetical protein